VSDLPVPDGVRAVLDTLWSEGHGAYVVGGAVRDTLLGRAVSDWDVATSARPEQIAALFSNGRYENKFGTVTVTSGRFDVQATTFRRDHLYGDHRRPDSVTFTDSVHEDLARRDFTVNAIAWGREANADAARFVDPTNGTADLDARLLRAVGDPATRFDEDALRLLRAARFAAQLNFEIEPRTLDAMRGTAETVRWVSHERIGRELEKMLAANPPSAAFVVLAATGILERALPELDAQRGIAQDKIPGHDLWMHCLTALDAAAAIDPDNPTLRLAALLHDIGKPTTYADGHFVGHDTEGAKLADTMLTRLAFPRRDIDRTTSLIREHMFNYESRWSAAAVRRFVRRIGRDRVDELLKLRAADNVGSGLPPNAGKLDELRRRIDDEMRGNPPLSLADLAVHGDDLLAALDVRPSPLVGRLLDHLMNLVVSDPNQNRRDVLLAHATDWLAKETAES
jgi:putative nucleotidyltransferase with HDIG domain